MPYKTAEQKAEVWKEVAQELGIPGINGKINASA